MYLSTLYKTLEVLFLRIEERKERQDGKVTASGKSSPLSKISHSNYHYTSQALNQVSKVSKRGPGLLRTFLNPSQY